MGDLRVGQIPGCALDGEQYNGGPAGHRSWYRNGHNKGIMGANSYFEAPTQCWEIVGGTQVQVIANYVLATGIHPASEKHYWTKFIVSNDGVVSAGEIIRDNTYAMGEQVREVMDVVVPPKIDYVWLRWTVESDEHDYNFGIRLQPKLTAPTNLAVAATGPTNAMLSWTNEEPGTSVRVWISQTRDGVVQPDIAVPAGQSSYALTSLDPTKHYSWTVRHAHVRGNDSTFNLRLSDPSNAVSWGAALPQPLSVYVAGPDEVRPFQTCTWTAPTDGGTPPYSYQWSQAGVAVPGATSQDFVTSASDESSINLSVVVKDAAGRTASGFLKVNSTSSAPAFCPSM